MMYPVINALQNIRRQYKRYRILVPLILICSLLTGIFMSIAVPCRLYTDQQQNAVIDVMDEDVIRRGDQNDRVRDLGESASLIQFGVMFLGAIAILFVSSLMIGERIAEVGILYAIGLSRGQIFASLFIELCTLCFGTLVIGLNVGKIAAGLYLKYHIVQQNLPDDILLFMGNGVSEILCLIVSVCILLFPILCLTVKLLRTDPNGFLRDRK